MEGEAEEAAAAARRPAAAAIEVADEKREVDGGEDTFEGDGDGPKVVRRVASTLHWGYIHLAPRSREGLLRRKDLRVRAGCGKE